MQPNRWTGQGRFIPLVASLLGTAILGGCAGLEKKPAHEHDDGVRPLLTEDNRAILREELAQFVDFTVSEIAATAENIEAQTESPEVRRAALHWKLQLVPEAHDVLDPEAPMSSLLDAWAFSVRLTQFLTAGDGREIFGEQQDLAVATARRLQTAVEDVARHHLPEDAMPKIVREIETYAREHPIRDMFVYDAADQFSTNVAVENRMMNILETPLRVFGKGIQRLDPTLRLSLSVDRFTDLMEDYPALVRWQTQLLVLQLQDTETIQSALASIQNISTTSVELVTTARTLPEEIRAQATQLLEAIETHQPALRQTLDDARKTIDEVNTALSQSEKLLADVRQAGQTLTETAHAVTGTVEQAQTLMARQEGTSDPDKRPFDITEYTATAEAVTAATTELRRALADIQDLITAQQGDGGPPPIKTVTAAVVDHAAWRLVQLCALVFVLAVIYRIISVLLRRKVQPRDS